jgi:hypothetical protein
MGDHRANVKIEFEFHGKTYKMDAYINYFPENGSVDERVTQFFESAYEDGISRYNEKIYKSQEKERKAKLEEDERSEYARLRSKYETKEKL